MDGEILQHLRAGQGVGFHDGEFLVREAARLVENFLVDGDLANVVKGGGRADYGDVRGGEVVAVRLLDQLVQHQLRQGPDVKDMKAALAVSEFHNMAENVDQQAAALLVFVNLVRHHAHQALLLGVEQNGVDHPAVNNQRVEGPGDEVRDAQLIGPLDVAGAGFGGDHDDGNVVNPMILGHDLQNAEAVHLRHDNIQQDQGNLSLLLLKQAHALKAVFGLDDLVLVGQHIRQNGPVEFRVVHNQYFLLLFCAQRDHILVLGSFAGGRATVRPAGAPP